MQLSRRYEADPTKYKAKLVVKLIYDRGSIKQVFGNHEHIKPDEWLSLGLPKQEDIPAIDFEVMV